MKKYVITAVVLVAVVYFFFSGPESEIVDEGEITEEKGIGSSLRKSFREILPEKDASSGEENLGKLKSGDHVVVINSKPDHLEVEDAIDRIEAQKDLPDNEALDYTRWTLFSENAKYSVEEKERILERAVKLLSPEQVKMLTMDVVMVGKVPRLVNEAMEIQTRDMSRKQVEDLIREILEARAEPEIRNAVIEFAASKNIYVK